MSLAWFLPLPGSYAGVDEVGVYNFACSLHEVLAKHPFLPHGCGLFSGSYFPSFSEGLSLRHYGNSRELDYRPHFPSFSEGLSLRRKRCCRVPGWFSKFPFLFGGTFIEAFEQKVAERREQLFPFLFGGTFIEAAARNMWNRSKTSISLPFRRDFH